MTGEFFGFYTAGNLTFVNMSKSEELLASYDTVIEGADTGWLPVLEDNGATRAIKTDRIVEGYISSERLDTQKDVVPLTAFTVEKDNEESMPLIEYIAKRAPLVYEHANTEKGVVPMGVVIGYKVEDDKPKFRWGVYKGSDLVDECWREMRKHGTAGGFSIGGAKIEPECDSQKCVLNKLDVVEISWTPEPANVDAKATWLNRVAKTIAKADDDEDLEKPCRWKKHAEAVKASDMDDEMKKSLLTAMKAGFGAWGERPKDPGDVFRLKPEDLEMKEDDEEDDDMEKETQKTGKTEKGTHISISESHTHYECDDCGHIWPKPEGGPEEVYVDISEVKCPECGSERVWEDTRSRYMATEKAKSPGSEQGSPEPTNPQGGITTAKKQDEEDKKPPADEEDDEDMEKSLLKALIEEIKGLRSDMAKTAKMEYGDDDDEDEDDEKSKSKSKKAKASTKEEDDEEDDDEEKSKKAKKAEELTIEKAVEVLEAAGYEIPSIEHGKTPRPEGGGQPLAKADDALFKRVREASFPALYPQVKEGA